MTWQNKGVSLIHFTIQYEWFWLAALHVLCQKPMLFLPLLPVTWHMRKKKSWGSLWEFYGPCLEGVNQLSSAFHGSKLNHMTIPNCKGGWEV